MANKILVAIEKAGENNEFHNISAKQHYL